MKISLRILLGYFLVVGLAAYFVLEVFIEEVRPGVRQTMEETLVDAAHLLAELAAPDLAAGRIAGGDFERAVRAYAARPVAADIWGRRKDHLDFRVYVTDAAGIVRFDSSDRAVGEDYSRWNDVLLTLEGRYGARTSREGETEASTVMYVAAPVKAGDRIIGVLTVGKPNAAVQPVIERSQEQIRRRGLLLLGASAAIGIFFTVWLTRALNRLRRYARDVAEGRKAPLPESGNSEIAELGRALEAMREKLEGKHYVEQYVHTLTHEMKSPLAAIQGAAELLDEEMPREDRARFIRNIREQCERMTGITERMLNLARLEQRQALQEPQPLSLLGLTREALAACEPRRAAAGVAVALAEEGDPVIRGEAFLVRQALVNLLDNAIDFSPRGGTVTVQVEQSDATARVRVSDEGPGIPEYARPRLFERFYSLPRPVSGRKGTGLGLPFVREVASLHAGSITLENRPQGGAEAVLAIPVV